MPVWVMAFCLVTIGITGVSTAADDAEYVEDLDLVVELDSTQPGTGDDVLGSAPEQPIDGRARSRGTLVASITIFVLAIFVGFEVITKVPPTLHTPLMSGSNAISGITLVGALLAAGAMQISMSSVVGALAVVLATINVVGGFLVTHRMLAMFRKK
jgi:NAD(P) transhydrogenase subunit alpha